MNPATPTFSDIATTTAGHDADTRKDAPELMRRVVQGAHETIDHLADAAAPQVQKLQQGVDDAGQRLHARADQIRTLGDEWMASLRGTVRESPLTAVATALLLGMLVARVRR